MKKTEFIKYVERAVTIKLKAVDRLIEEIVEPLADIGNPEKLIGKPYEAWSAQDLNMLANIYGTGDDTVLARTIFNREYEKLKRLELEETGNA